LLEVSDVVTRYGAVEALRGVSLAVREGELVCLLGANGAGKSTLLKSIVGLLSPARGRVVFQGADITGRAPEAILKAGIALVPERRRVFGALTVRDNLLLGGYALPRAGDFAARMERGLDEVQQLFPVLRARAGQLAGTLSGGEQQMLAIGRALMSRPRLLLCDEPSLGLAPLVTREIMRLLAELPARGTTVLLVEQNARLALRIAARAYVLETGTITLEGPAHDLLDHHELKAAYLGGSA
jgi:branched-chain amino acid transport system ATP-binding protein